jgi:hypothetical protein
MGVSSGPAEPRHEKGGSGGENVRNVTGVAPLAILDGGATCAAALRLLDVGGDSVALCDVHAERARGETDADDESGENHADCALDRGAIRFVGEHGVTPLFSALAHAMWTLDFLIAEGVPTLRARAPGLRFRWKSRA